MELTNKRVQYSITNHEGGLIINGEVTANIAGIISNFSGSFAESTNPTYAGNFSYSESGENGEICNRNINGAPKELRVAIDNLIDATVVAVKAQILV